MDRAGTVRPASPIYTFILHDYTLINSYWTAFDFDFKNLFARCVFFSQNLVFNSTSCPPYVPLYLTIKLWSTRKKHFGVLDLILNEFDLAWEVLKYIFVMKSSQHLNLIGAHWCPLVPIGAQWGGTKRSILTPAGARWPPFGTQFDLNCS